MADTVGPLRTEHSPAGSQLTFLSQARTVVPSVPWAREVITGCCRAGTAPGYHREAVPGYCAPGGSVPGPAGATSTASVFGLRRCRLATQVANQESSMHIPM